MSRSRPRRPTPLPAPDRLPGRRGAGLEVGWARVEITPPIGSTLAGVISKAGRIASRIHDPLFARALALRHGETEAVVLVADLLAIPDRLHEEVASRAALAPEGLLLAATHTHSGPGGYWDAGRRARIFTGRYDEAIFERLATALAKAAREARHRLGPAAALRAGRAALPGASANRRCLHGPVDPDLTLLRFETAGEPPIDLVSFSAHPVIASEREPFSVSGDFPGDLCARLERRGVHPIFFQGAVAALSPLFPEFPMKFDTHLALVGGLLERGWEDAARTLVPVRVEGIDARIVQVPLPPPQSRVIPDGMRGARIARAAAAPLAGWLRGMAQRGRSRAASAPLHLVRLGRAAALLGTPCDLSVGMALALKRVLRETGIAFPIVGSQCDAYVGYVLSPEEYAHVPEQGFRFLGLYENAMSLSGWGLGADFVRALPAALSPRVRPSPAPRIA